MFVSRYASHLFCDAFAEVLGSGVVGTLPIVHCMRYASWGPMFSPFLRRSARALTSKPYGEPLQLKAFAAIKRALGPVAGGSVPLTGPSVPVTEGVCSPYGPLSVV